METARGMSLTDSSNPSAPPDSVRNSWQNFAWMSAGRLFRALLSVTVGAWAARYLGPADYGLLNSAQAGVMLLFALTGLGLDSLVRQQLVRETDRAGAILGTCIALRALAGLLVYAGLALATWNTGAARPVWLILGVMLVTHVLMATDFWFQARLEMRVSALAQNAAFALSSLLRIGLILGHAPLPWFAGVIVLDGPVVGAILLWKFRRKTGARLAWQGDYVRPWLSRCWPLLLANLATAAFTGVNQLLLLGLGGPADAGRFAAAERVLALALFVPVALVTTLIPSFVPAPGRSAATAEHNVRRALSQSAMLGWSTAAALFALAPWIVAGLYGPQYAGAESALRVLALSLLLNGLGAVRAEWWVAAGWTRRLLVATTLGALLNALLACWFIPSWGATGAAAASIIAATIAFLGSGWLWPDTRPFARWQLAAMLGGGWRHAFKDRP